MDYSLIHNDFLGDRSDIDNLETTRKKKGVHHLETAPAHAKKCRGSNCDYSAKYISAIHLTWQQMKGIENVLYMQYTFLAMQVMSHISCHGEQYLRIIEKLNSVLTFL